MAVVATVSLGTIKAVERGVVDVRASTLRKVAQTIAFHKIEFEYDGHRSGIWIANSAIPDLSRVEPDEAAGTRIKCA